MVDNYISYLRCFYLCYPDKPKIFLLNWKVIVFDHTSVRRFGENLENKEPNQLCH